MSNNYHYVFKPVPGTSQELALACPCDSILLCGTRGGMKTLTQLMLFRKNVGIGYGSYWRGVIFDIEYKDLEDVLVQSQRFFLAFEDGAKFLKSMAQYKWVWPTGEELLLRVGSEPDDYLEHHGKEYPFIGFNEISKQHSPKFMDDVLTCNRSSFVPELHSPRDREGNIQLLPPIPLRFVATTNPFGAGRAWIKKRYIDPAPYGQMIRTRAKVFNPQTQQTEVIERTHVTLFSSYIENPYISPKYVAILHAQKDKNKKAAWLFGRWDVSAGGAIDEVWRDDVHIIDRFSIPKNWYVDRTFDWGSTHPFSVGWWAESNGEEVHLPNGKVLCFPAGTIIMIAEWYGAEEEDWGENKGLKMDPKDVAKGIKAIDKYLIEKKLVNSPIHGGPADNQIRNVIVVGQNTIEKTMELEGVEWTKSDKSDGSRSNGLILFKERLSASVKQEGPGFYVMRNCRAFIELVPPIPPHPVKIDDTDPKYEDHCLGGNTIVNCDHGNFKIKDLVGNSGLVYSLDRKLVKFFNCRKTRDKEFVVRISVGNTPEFTCTLDHQLMGCNRSWITISRYILLTCYNSVSSIVQENVIRCELSLLTKQFNDLMELIIIFVENISKIKGLDYTEKFLNTLMDSCLKEENGMFIIKMIIDQIIKLRISNFYQEENIILYMVLKMINQNGLQLGLRELLSGIGVNLGENGIENIIEKYADIPYTEKLMFLAKTVEILLKVLTNFPSFVQESVKLLLEGIQELTKSLDTVLNVDGRFLLTNIKKQLLVLDLVQGKEALVDVTVIDHGFEDVYCLDVDDHSHAFCIENGVVSHNCWDMTRYKILDGGRCIAGPVSVYPPS